ncbi:outer membrane protein assembly factor BamE [Commensalibacter melissae]|uniref:outer membrane protein assembly factor BamE n=1 Tax=Commensalibacter melissae TaxID=2070537 RepID=UPI0012D9074D|nr:outer membrane protein assembly factor BamE [Commensalibacter melissae]MCT6841633.1 outer membrane protein assembly factor BamE [Commensalibacter sp.]MCT6895680.1 outer membrane protein assembly factor BamE [Commensalibacter sp.]MUG09220.1 outer membrane protein assembly factor BamE [Commensalibacter melissae]
MRFLKYMIIPTTVLLMAGCESASKQAQDAQTAQNTDAHLTLGTIESQLHKGMSNASVVEIFGPPNIVTSDDQHQEVWVYDRISTMRTHSSSGGWATIVILGLGNKANTSSTSQRTLTLIVKFDHNQKVRDYSYRYSNF